MGARAVMLCLCISNEVVLQCKRAAYAPGNTTHRDRADGQTAHSKNTIPEKLHKPAVHLPPIKKLIKCDGLCWRYGKERQRGEMVEKGKGG